MANPQPGIFAQGTRFHYHLELDLRPDADPAAVLEATARVRQPSVTVGGANVVIGFAPDLWRRIAGSAAPDALAAFPAVDGVPVTQHDIWVWTHGGGPDVLLDVARATVGDADRPGSAHISRVVVERTGAGPARGVHPPGHRLGVLRSRG